MHDLWRHWRGAALTTNDVTMLAIAVNFTAATPKAWHKIIHITFFGSRALERRLELVFAVAHAAESGDTVEPWLETLRLMDTQIARDVVEAFEWALACWRTSPRRR